FEARGSKPNHPPITHPWLQPNGFVWPGHWQEPWLDVMTRMAENLAERLQQPNAPEAARAS
ncbi:MAG: hypothetical protein AAGC83_14225, partial [Pseudomonadota bacterium]